MIKHIFIIVLFLLIGSLPMKAQYAESKERKKMWRKSFKRRKNRQAFNPYLDKKASDKPSAQLDKTNKREQRRQLRAAKKQKKKSMKKLGIKETKVKRAK